MKKRWFDKKGSILGFEISVGWVIAIAILIIALLGYLILSGKANEAIDNIKNIFKFGR